MKTRRFSAATIYYAAAWLFFGALAVQAAPVYVSQALGVVDASNNPVSQLLGSAGNPSGGPVAVDQSLILGVPNNTVWMSLTQGEQATFGFGSTLAPVSVFVAVLANGSNETGTLYGRASAADPFTLIGSITEPNVGSVGAAPNIETFSLAATGLSEVGQLEIVSMSSAGSFPGLDIQGLGATTNTVGSAPEPEGWALLLAGISFVALVARRKSISLTVEERAKAAS